MTAPESPASAAVELLGDLVSALPGGGEARKGQTEMTALVADALAAHGRLAVRAGTGTGKSLAILAAVAGSGTRTVIATATKALQDQYAEKELPFVAEQHPLDWAVLKGRSNYVCLARLADARSVLAGEPPPDTQEMLFEVEAEVAGTEDLGGAQEDRLAVVMDWVTGTESGDLSELPFELDRRTAGWVATGPDGCPGADKCSHGESCFAEAAIASAREAQVVLVNTALLGADLALDGAVLGDADAYVIDEAHEAEDILSSAFGAELRGDDLLRVERNVRMGVRPAEELRSSLRRTAAVVDRELGEHSDEVFRDGFPSKGDLATTVGRAAGVAAEAQAAARNAVKANSADARAEAARRSADRLAEAIERLTAKGTDDAIWVEEPGPAVRRVPIDVGDRLAAQAWGDCAVVVTSATVSEPMVSRLGLGSRGKYVDVGSPFDHRAAAMLYVPPLLQSAIPRDRTPNNPDWADAAWKEAAAVIDAAEGRTLFLCTSMRNARGVRRAGAGGSLLAGATPGGTPQAEAAGRVRRRRARRGRGHHGPLAGGRHRRFLPELRDRGQASFPRPDDPLWQARSDASRKRLIATGVSESDAGYRSFLEVQVPRAASLLAQGTGRLIRTATDRGLVVVLDPRLAEKAYRKQILDELPPMRRTRIRSEAVAHLRSGLDDQCTGDESGQSAADVSGA